MTNAKIKTKDQLRRTIEAIVETERLLLKETTYQVKFQNKARISWLGNHLLNLAAMIVDAA